MLKNYLVVVFRSLRRQKGYAFINVSGLAVGLACCILIVLYVRSERAVDTVFDDVDRIYRIGSEWRDEGAGLPITAPAPIGEKMVETFPEAQASVRLWAGWLNVRSAEGDVSAFRRSAYVADANVISFFGIPLLHGSAETALRQPRSVVLREDLARAVFGTADAVGRTLLVETYNNGTQPYTVTGVWEPLAFNSFTRFGGGEFALIVSFAPGDVMSEEEWTSWENRYLLHYVKLAPGTAPDAVSARLANFVRAVAPEEYHGMYEPVLQPLRTLYLDDEGGRNRRAVHLLTGLAVLILLVACINFANLATAQALRRGKEIGVRKSIGARRGQIVGQYLGEAVVVAALATVLGALLARVLQNPFFELVGKPLVLPNPWDLPTALTLVGIALATGVLAGAYPALMLSGFQPVRALKGTLRTGPASARLRQGLVVTQFVAAVLLLAGAAVVYEQTAFLRTAPLGFEREHVLAIESVPRDWSAEGVARLQPVKARLEAVPGVRAVSLSWETAAEGGHGNTLPLRRPGQPPEAALDVARFLVDEDFAEVYDLRLADGVFLGENDDGVMLNERAAAAFGIERAGQPLVLGDSAEVEVRGIVKDFHYTSLHEPIRPLVMASLAEVPLYRTFSLRFAGSDPAGTLRRVEAAWHEVLPAAPFDYTFVDEQVAAQYVTERRTGTVVVLAAMLAVLVSGLGLIGLVSISVLQRRREIGVRKVLGATVPSLVALLAKDFVVLVGVAFVVAVPVAWVGMSRWLDGFAYRIALGPEPFLITGALLLVIVVATVSTQALRAARKNPTEALRYE